MNILFRWIKRIILSLLVLLAIFIAVLVVLNWRDEPLTPEAARLLALPAPATPDEPNAYYVLLGFEAPDNEDAMKAGKRLRDEFDRQRRENILNIDDPDAGAHILMEEINAHRRFLAGSSTILGRSVGVAMLNRDYAVLSDAIERWPTLAQQAALDEAWLPLQAQKNSMRSAIEAEARLQAN
ncbi:MAG: hypothetical protein LBB65_02785 [Burkholderiales bacterium]|jgi:uncharacterized SAM-binding protein YcdF (DUF218 family)|nr:hypothetical protein [Burkholderiales bacterium]